jgi:hypothetical protein
MTVAPTGYLKSHHATKQEAQLQKVEQSAFVEITDSQGLSDSHPATNQQAQLQKIK